MERGGRADKLGNRYEGLWVARQFVRLLADEARSVTIESVGDDEDGVDLWVVETDGTREAQQCKRENEIRGKWLISDLHRRSVLKRLRFQLDRDSASRVALVSGNDAPDLRGLTERANSSDGSVSGFYANQILPYAVWRRALGQFCNHLNLNAENPSDREYAFNLLRRIRVVTFSLGQEGRSDVRLFARAYIAGDPESVVADLLDLVSDETLTGLSIRWLRVRVPSASLGIADLAPGCSIGCSVGAPLGGPQRPATAPSLIWSPWTGAAGGRARCDSDAWIGPDSPCARSRVRSGYRHNDKRFSVSLGDLLCRSAPDGNSCNIVSTCTREVPIDVP